MIDVHATKPTKNTMRSTGLRTSMMTPVERARGRFMRAPDHDASTAAPAPTIDTTTTDAPAPTAETTTAPADVVTDATDTTILGGGEGKGDGEGTEPKDGEAAKAASVAPEKYELTVPEGMTLDTDTLALADPVFRELNLDNAGAQKLSDVFAQVAPRIAEQAVTADRAAQSTNITEQRAAWAAEAKADPEIGGAKWTESVAASAKALDRLGAPAGSPFRQLLDDSGLGNHPEMIRMFTRIGAAIGEDGDFMPTERRAAVPRDSAEILYPNDTPKGA